MFISSGTSARYSIDRQFLVPGKRFFNESLADSTLPIPPKHIKAEKARNKVISAIFDDVPLSEEPVAPPTQEEDDSWSLECLFKQRENAQRTKGNEHEMFENLKTE